MLTFKNSLKEKDLRIKDKDKLVKEKKMMLECI